ncbi:MAG: hypothetical protein LBO69_09955, partial [Ignavibacteria bacterium]|nr:hypothetical protein [Ignavibacteria bacterium]
MTKLYNKFGYLLIATMFIALAGCSSDDNNNVNPYPNDDDTSTIGNYFNVKSGKVVYSTNGIEDDNPDVVLYFDDYGKKLRCENLNNTQIVDEDANLGVVLYPEWMEYYSTPAAMLGSAVRGIYHFTMDDLYESYKLVYPDITKGTETIAGKSCNIYKWSVAGFAKYENAGWNGITFLYREEALGSVQEWRVKEFSEESVSADKFVIPDGY